MGLVVLGHLIYATGFMFLISWRGYWQELIESLAWAHERTPIADLVRWKINQLLFQLYKLV
jgi:photosystem I P700 chlorophyll a apoprotein A2